MHIAILGGSFDPIHKGHLYIANYALHHLPIDQVWFMPTMDTPLKDRKLTAFTIRAKMISSAIKPYRKMRLCTLEQERTGKSYTIDTVKQLLHDYPKHTFCWLIGSDQLKQLDAWKDIDEILKLITFYVFTRTKEAVETPYPVTFMPMPLMDISATEIRRGEKLWMMPKGVRESVGKQALYVETMVQAVMNKQRFQHSCSVAQVCMELAKIHHVEPKKAYLAGMLHDVCKPWEKEKSLIWMRHLEPDLLEEHPNVWHGYIASKYVKRYYHIRDHDVLFAIRHHVKGSTHSKLAMILYIADKLDPSRGYDSSATITLAKQNLDAGYDAVQQQQAKYLTTKGVINE